MQSEQRATRWHWNQPVPCALPPVALRGLRAPDLGVRLHLGAPSQDGAELSGPSSHAVALGPREELEAQVRWLIAHAHELSALGGRSRGAASPPASLQAGLWVDREVAMLALFCQSLPAILTAFSKFPAQSRLLPWLCASEQARLAPCHIAGALSARGLAPEQRDRALEALGSFCEPGALEADSDPLFAATRARLLAHSQACALRAQVGLGGARLSQRGRL